MLKLAEMSNVTWPRIPKLEPGTLPQPYVRSVGSIARADASRLVDPEERRIANRPRKVEDPFQVKERQKKVCGISSFSRSIYAI